MSSRKPSPAPAPAYCVTRSVVQALSENPSLEAVTINRERQTVSLATLGQTDAQLLEQRLHASLERAQAAQAQRQCTILTGKGDCLACPHPLPEADHKRISIQHDGPATTIARVTCPTAPKFWRWRDIPLPKVVPREVEFPEDDHAIDEWKPQLAAAVLCGVGVLTAWALPHHGAVWIASYIVAFLAGSWFTAIDVWERLRAGAIDVHFLMLAVAAGSASIGAYGEGAVLLFLFSFSSALEHFALGRTHREIRSLFREAPKSGTVIDAQGHETQMPVERLSPGMRLLIRPGAQFPVDSEIVKGKTASDESNLTGEAAPVPKSVGDKVFAGTMNLWGAVEAMVTRPASESSLQKIIKLIKEARQQKAPAQQFTDKFSTYYTYFALALAFGMFFVWWLILKYPAFTAPGAQTSAFYLTMTLLVVASPCALVLSIPSAVLAAIAWGARHGILFRGGAAVEKLASVTAVALDKTGTLTTGDLRVEKVESFPAGREHEVAILAYSIERLSTHPLARAITRYGKHNGFRPVEMDHFESVTGHGLQAMHEGTRCLLGRRDWLAEIAGSEKLASLPPVEPGCSEICLLKGDLLGRLILRDDIRPQSRQVIEELRSEGLKTLVLTGDHAAAGHHLRTELHVDDVHAELKPEQKVDMIRKLGADGHKVGMIGDGVNDAPSLAAAHIGIAMGARGSDAALEQADIVLMHDRLENFMAAFKLSRRARAIIRQNLVISLGTVVVLVTCALLGKIPLTIGVVGHEGSTVVVVVNSLRLLLGHRTASASHRNK